MYDYYAVIPHSTKPSILLLQDEGGWSLPHWETPHIHFWQACDHINRTIQERFALQVITLRCLVRDQNPQTGHLFRIHELENRDPDWLPPYEGAWIGQAEFQGLDLVPQAHRAVLDAWFAERVAGISPQRRAWARRGWFDEAESLINRILQQQERLKAFFLMLLTRRFINVLPISSRGPSTSQWNSL